MCSPGVSLAAAAQQQHDAITHMEAEHLQDTVEDVDVGGDGGAALGWPGDRAAGAVPFMLRRRRQVLLEDVDEEGGGGQGRVQGQEQGQGRAASPAPSRPPDLGGQAGPDEVRQEVRVCPQIGRRRQANMAVEVQIAGPAEDHDKDHEGSGGDEDAAAAADDDDDDLLLAPKLRPAHYRARRAALHASAVAAHEPECRPVLELKLTARVLRQLSPQLIMQQQQQQRRQGAKGGEGRGGKSA